MADLKEMMDMADGDLDKGTEVVNQLKAEIDRMLKGVKEVTPEEKQIMDSIQEALKEHDLKFSYDSGISKHVDLDFGMENKPFRMNIIIQNGKIIYRLSFPFRVQSNAIPFVTMYIGKKFIIPQLLKNFELRDKDLRFSEDVLRYIITDFCEDGGARDLQHNIEKVIRRVISSGSQKEYRNLTVEMIDDILSPLVRETQAIFFNRHREEYSEAVAKEIKRCLSDIKGNTNNGSDAFEDDKRRQRLDYLLSCRSEIGVFQDEFDPIVFSEKLHENLYGMDRVIKEATLFYHTASLQGTILNSNLALCGGFGIGKTTIVKNIAEAMGYNFVKISLNGIDDVRELRGFSSTYVGSEPGRIVKGIKKAGSLKTVWQDITRRVQRCVFPGGIWIGRYILC